MLWYCIVGRFLSGVVMCCQVWSSVVMCSQVWSCVVKCGHMLNVISWREIKIVHIHIIASDNPDYN